MGSVLGGDIALFRIYLLPFRVETYVRLATRSPENISSQRLAALACRALAVTRPTQSQPFIFDFLSGLPAPILFDFPPTRS
jgi:hypothetical protein